MSLLTRFVSPLLLAAVFGVSSLVAQTPPAKKAASTGGVSPHETTSAVIDGNRVTLVYGRPSTKNPKTGEPRKVWGELVPWGKVWRTGSDEATMLVTQKPIVFGSATVPAGAYTVWTIPNEDGTAVLILNKQLGQWGAAKSFQTVYDEKNDLARVPMQREPLSPPAEQFTMMVEKNPAGGGIVRLKWNDAQYSAPFTVAK